MLANTWQKGSIANMRIVPEEIVNEEDTAPVEMLASLFEARDWPFAHSSDDEISAEVKGAWTTYQFQAVWRAEDRVLQLLCLPEIRVPEHKRAYVYEALALINEQLWLGHFDIWSNGSMVLYRHGLMLGEEGLLGPGRAQMVVEAAIEECDRFYPVFQFILWGDKTPQEALVSAMVDAVGEA